MLPQRKRLAHDVPPWADVGSVFFVTVCCAERGRNQLCHSDIGTGLIEAVEFRQRQLRWFVHLVVLMPDHLHALISFPEQESLGKSVASFKEVTAKRLGIRWQTGFFDHRLRHDESYELKAAYVRENPVRAGLVVDASLWPWVWEPTVNGGPSGPALPRT